MEKWKDIPGYDEMYQISNLGRVQSWKRHQGRPGKRKEPVVLKQTPSSPGYLRVSLWKNGVRQDGYIHRLIAEMFIPNPEDKEVINHLDGDKTNNCISNLHWSTPSENLIHAYDSGLRRKGNMTKKRISELKKSLLSGRRPIGSICDEYEITKNYAKRIISGECWSSV